LEVVDGLGDPPQPLARPAKDAERDALTVAVPVPALDLQRPQARGQRLVQPAQVEPGAGHIIGGPRLPPGVTHRAVDRKRLLEVAGALLSALVAVGHAEVVEHPRFGLPVTYGAGAGQANLVRGHPITPVAAAVVEGHSGGGQLPGGLGDARRRGPPGRPPPPRVAALSPARSASHQASASSSEEKPSGWTPAGSGSSGTRAWWAEMMVAAVSAVCRYQVRTRPIAAARSGSVSWVRARSAAYTRSR